MAQAQVLEIHNYLKNVWEEERKDEKEITETA